MANPTPQRSRWDEWTERAVGLLVSRDLGLTPHLPRDPRSTYDVSLRDEGAVIARLEVRRRDFGPDDDFARAAVLPARKLHGLIATCSDGAIPLYALALRDGSVRLQDARVLVDQHPELAQPFLCRGLGDAPDFVWYIDVQELALLPGADWLATFRALTGRAFDWRAAKAAHPRHVMR